MNPKNEYKTKNSGKIHKQMVTTSYEKVLSILSKIKKFLLTLENTKELIQQISWVISIITTHTLFKSEFLYYQELLEKNQSEFPEFKDFVDFMTNSNDGYLKKNNDILTKTIKLMDKDNSLEEIEKLGMSLKLPSRKLKRKHMTMISPIAETNELLSRSNKHFLSIMSKNSNENDNNNNISNNDENNVFKNYSSNDPNPVNKITRIPSMSKKITLKKLREIAAENLFNDEENEFSSQNENLYFDEEEDGISNNYSSKNDLNVLSTHDLLGNNESNDKINSFNPILIEKALNDSKFNLKSILTWEFDIFKFKSIVGYSNVLPIIGRVLFEYFGVTDQMINLSKLDPFLYEISNGYHSTVLYHNAIHGADVTQSVALMFINSNIDEVAYTTIQDVISIITAALSHDIGHPGTTNLFQTNTLSDFAITYNDISILESFHCATLFRIIKNNDFNIFDKFSDSDFKILRKRIISQILSTDMANHAKVLGVIKSKVLLFQEKLERKKLKEGLTNKNECQEAKGSNESLTFVSKDSNNIFQEQEEIFDFIIHAADIGHNSKKFNISVQWVELLSNEFWKQGDKEKNLNIKVSFLCDRNDVNIPKSQIGFIKAFINPVFDLLADLFPTLYPFKDNAHNNLDTWIQLAEQKRKTGFTPEKKKISSKEDDEEDDKN